MKHLLTTGLLLITGTAFLPHTSSAATLTYTADDLFLGFRKEGSTTDYLINIGQASQYRDLAQGASITLSLGNILTDLNTIFGTSWKTDGTVFWGIVGTPGASAVGSDPANTLYATKPELPFGSLADAYLRSTAGNQGGVRSDILSLAASFSGKTSSANSSVALIQLTSDSNSWASYNPDGTSFSYFQGMEGNFSGGTAVNALDLFRMQPTTTAGLSGTYEGTFTISDSGTVTFTNTPEPTATALLAASTGLLGLRRRRIATSATA